MALASTAVFADLEIVKSHLRMSSGTQDEQYVPVVERLVNEMSEEIEAKTGRVYRSRSISEMQDGRNSHLLILRAWPVVSIESFSIGGTAVSASEYAMDADGGLLKMLTGPVLWDPCLPGKVLVTYTAGYALSSIPARVQGLVLDMIKLRFDEWRNGLTVATSINIGPSNMVIKPGWPYQIREAFNELSRERLVW